MSSTSPAPLESIRFSRPTPLRITLSIVDQLLLPHEVRWFSISSVPEAWSAIRNMNIRGAPALASLATLSVSQDLVALPEGSEHLASIEAFRKYVEGHCEYLFTARPTAVNLGIALERLRGALKAGEDVREVREKVVEEGITVWSEDVGRNMAMADHGAKWVLAKLEKEGKIPAGGKISVLTVCNTGSLATSGYGTALGLITRLHELGRLERAYYTQTTPYHQGSRLTALELTTLRIPSCMVCDTAVGSLMQSGAVHAVAVGADRIALTGATANKIGTFQSALLASHFHLPFLVVAPTATIDPCLTSGDSIPIEQRPAIEACEVRGRVVRGEDVGGQATVRVAPEEVGKEDWARVYNPGFDVTPAGLVSAVVTERGVAERGEGGEVDVRSVL